MVFRLRFKDRVLEWHVAVYTLLFGIWLSQPADALNPVTLRLILDMVPEAVLGVVFTLIGAVHLVALAINGAAWWTPLARSAAASLNLFAYLFLAVSIYAAAPHSSGVPTYGLLVVPELVTVCFRAMRDAFSVQRVRTHARV